MLQPSQPRTHIGPQALSQAWSLYSLSLQKAWVIHISAGMSISITQKKMQSAGTALFLKLHSLRLIWFSKVWRKSILKLFGPVSIGFNSPSTSLVASIVTDLPTFTTSLQVKPWCTYIFLRELPIQPIFKIYATRFVQSIFTCFYCSIIINWDHLLCVEREQPKERINTDCGNGLDGWLRA